MIGHTRTEQSVYLIDAPDPDAMTQDDVVAALRDRLDLGDRAQEVFDTYRRDRPDARLRDLLVLMMTDGTFGNGSIAIAERRAALGRGNTFFYVFDWQTPIMGLQSPHTLEIPFVFNNLERASDSMLGPLRPSMRGLQVTMSDTWVGFARSGNPAQPPPAVLARVRHQNARDHAARYDAAPGR